MSAARCLLAVPDWRTILFVELLPTFATPHHARCGVFLWRRKVYAVQKLKLKGASRSCSASHSHCAQVLPFHRRHLRAWRFSCLDTQTPLRRVWPGPHAAAI